MNKVIAENSIESFSAIEKAKEKALKESYPFKGSQTSQSINGGREASNKKKASIKITVRK